MVRYEIEGNPISIAYGSDVATGIFLSVTDKRLKWSENATDEVNKVAESVGVKDGGGSYFDLHTGQMGFGVKVSKATMAVYMQRYGVPKKHIDALMHES